MLNLVGTFIMFRTCAWCGKPLGTRDCSPCCAGKTSHGACPECRDKILHAPRDPRLNARFHVEEAAP